jgi:NADPH-dependent 2,4-dienoyl-CoA reductase/sulfur reductase-like enzyme
MRPLLLAPLGGLALGLGLLPPAPDRRERQPPATAIVIGGGIIGVSTAYQLARRGVAVTLLEERPEVGQVEAAGLSAAGPGTVLPRWPRCVTGRSSASPWRPAGRAPACWPRTRGR